MPLHAHHRRGAVLALAGTGAFVLLVLLVNVAVFSPSSWASAPSLPWYRPSGHTAPASPAPEEEKIVISMVMFGRSSAEEGQHMLKSILMRASAPVELHIVCSDDAVPVLQRRLDLVTRPVHDVDVVFYPLTEDAVVTRGERAGIGNKRHHAGVGGLAKMFIHELVPAPLALYVDTDAMFLTDPLHLWHTARRLTAADADTLLAFPHAGPHSDGGDICTCVMAMHLARMRAAPWLESTLRAETVGRALGGRAVWARAGIDPARPPWGDQGLVHAIWRAHPTRFARLSRSWDVSACKYYYGVTLVGEDFRSPAQEAAKYVNLAPAAAELAAKETGAKDGQVGKEDWELDLDMGEVLFPGIVHFNCQGGEKEENVFRSGPLRARPEWGPLLVATAQYKWVWLNQGTGTLTSRVVPNATFEDERVAAARGPTRLSALHGAHYGGRR
ncbi:hypothetical protein AURDEDRAFT_112338 [Auricularia subglabra TFB-10046 SS5]|nr:hypothetical protein AURDEDRAFT_112338 [Auricularia subglabra TFB-10046 SS5]